ncbi:hypothetical protein HYPSUDRAFT_206529 [Hypholoma sublateritium FD-334 SS-4]|uniref:Uncharacterized protein n=1 Tax=Hypholoma sublateritium (strain FD-334 SS-4) TaxID=945553 RepID=A0A0D2M1P9_HYPSF|nr:hypothetical protein HYPSUDRAFT_206529 [Hypholoma sublateritium FD-334 SS-4]
MGRPADELVSASVMPVLAAWWYGRSALVRPISHEGRERSGGHARKTIRASPVGVLRVRKQRGERAGGTQHERGEEAGRCVRCGERGYGRGGAGAWVSLDRAVCKASPAPWHPLHPSALCAPQHPPTHAQSRRVEPIASYRACIGVAPRVAHNPIPPPRHQRPRARCLRLPRPSSADAHSRAPSAGALRMVFAHPRIVAAFASAATLNPPTPARDSQLRLCASTPPRLPLAPPPALPRPALPAQRSILRRLHAWRMPRPSYTPVPPPRLQRSRTRCLRLPRSSNADAHSRAPSPGALRRVFAHPRIVVASPSAARIPPSPAPASPGHLCARCRWPPRPRCPVPRCPRSALSHAASAPRVSVPESARRTVAAVPSPNAHRVRVIAAGPWRAACRRPIVPRACAHARAPQSAAMQSAPRSSHVTRAA